MPELTDLEASRVLAAIKWIRHYLQIAEQARITVATAPGSAKAIDGLSPAGDVAFDMADLQLSATTDHLVAATTLMAQGIPRYGCYVLFRGAIEATAGAYWLMEPSCSDLERQARSLTAQLLNVYATRKANPAVDSHLQHRIDHFRKTAAELGLNESTDARYGTLVGFDKPPPNITDRIQRMPTFKAPGTVERPIARAYSTLSAFAHGEIWAFLANKAVLAEDDSHSVLEISVDVDQLLHFASLAVSATDTATAAYLGLATGNASAWETQPGQLPRL